jgi:hypothetical protein
MAPILLRVAFEELTGAGVGILLAAEPVPAKPAWVRLAQEEA